MHRILTVIVNYRTAALTADCLRSLAEERRRAELAVVVVDNASGDGSAGRIAALIAAEGWGGWVRLEARGANDGFAAGNNAGVRAAAGWADDADLIWLLNPDTVVRPGAAAALAGFLRAHPGCGIAASRLEHADGEPQRSAFRFPSVAGEFENGIRSGPVSRVLSRYVVAPPVADRPHPADWAAGASMMIRRGVWDALGGMDAGYFLYFEETDFCRRAAEAGWATWYVPASRVVHLVGRSTGVTGADRSRRRMPRYWFESRRRYFVRHLGRFRTGLADAAWSIGFALWTVRRWVQGLPEHEPPGLLGDFVRFSLRPDGP